MQHALCLARYAAKYGEVPVGAVLVRDEQLIADGWNQPIHQHDPSAHAEIIALRTAAKQLNNYRLPDMTLYVTLEPCAMCVGAMIHARIKRLVFATWDPRAGAVCSAFNIIDAPMMNHRIEWGEGVLAEKSSILLKNFFAERR